MSEISKYESLLNELNTLETQASVVRNKYKDTFARNSELENQIITLKKENLNLAQKISKLQEEIENIRNEREIEILNSLNLKERETLKIKLQNLISKIEYHLTAERQT